MLHYQLNAAFWSTNRFNYYNQYVKYSLLLFILFFYSFIFS